MEKTDSATALKKAIQLLEIEQAQKGERLKAQFLETINTMKPVNLLKSTLKDVSSSPDVIENIVGITLSLASGYFTRKLVVGASAGIARKILIPVIQFGISKVITANTHNIMSISNSVVRLFSKNKSTPAFK